MKYYEPQQKNNIPLQWQQINNWETPDMEFANENVRSCVVPIMKKDHAIVVSPKGTFLQEGMNGKAVVNGPPPPLPEIDDNMSAEEKKAAIDKARKGLKMVIWSGTYGDAGGVFFGPCGQQKNCGQVNRKGGSAVGIVDADGAYISHDGFRGSSGIVHGEGFDNFFAEPIWTLGRWVAYPIVFDREKQEFDYKKSKSNFVERLRSAILNKYELAAIYLAQNGQPANPLAVWQAMSEVEQKVLTEKIFAKGYWETYKSFWLSSDYKKTPVPIPESTMPHFPKIDGKMLAYEIQ